MHGINITAYLAWIVACIVGAFIGNWLPNPEQFGLDFALSAMFIGLLYLQVVSDKSKNEYKFVSDGTCCTVFDSVYASYDT